VYDYVLGKVDWMAYGLPVEGTRGPYVGSALIDVPTCRPEEPAATVGVRLGNEGRAAVVTGRGVAVGLVDVHSLRHAPEGATVMDVMEIVPDTLRPSVLLEKLDDRVAGRLVTTPDGELLGAVDPTVLRPHEHTHTS
jgi:hypothetical protein